LASLNIRNINNHCEPSLFAKVPYVGINFKVQVVTSVQNVSRNWESLSCLLYGDFGFRLEPIFTAAPDVSQNDAQFKSGQN
jgi:hypothetical protein